MKLLIESWRNYTASILNEDLLIESYEQAQESVVARASKWFKGYVYEHDKDIYDKIEEKIKKEVVDTWGLDYNKAALENIRKSDYVLHWDIGGYVLLFTFNQYFVPNDLTDKQKQIALLWSYRQFVSGNVLNISSMEEFVFSLVSMLLTKVKSSKYVYDLMTAGEGGEEREGEYGGDEIYDYYWRYFSGLAGELEDFATEEESIVRKNLIERFFQWNRFIRDGKRDLNTVVDFNELYELVTEARPLYQTWQDKQNQKDAEAGKELLLDDDNWQIIAIHNKGAACELGKGTDWCTAAPGLEYFKRYYKPNDPLFYILDKSDGERYQFHFGSDQFMDKYDNQLSPSRYHVEEEIMKVLAKVVPQNYDIAYDYLNKYRLE